MKKILVAAGLMLVLTAVGLTRYFSSLTTNNEQKFEYEPEIDYTIDFELINFDITYDILSSGIKVYHLNYEIKNIGNITAEDANICFEVKAPEGHRVIYEHITLVNILAGETFTGECAGDYPLNYAEYLNGRLTIYYTVPPTQYSRGKAEIQFTAFYRSDASEGETLYYLSD